MILVMLCQTHDPSLSQLFFAQLFKKLFCSRQLVLIIYKLTTLLNVVPKCDREYVFNSMAYVNMFLSLALILLKNQFLVFIVPLIKGHSLDVLCLLLILFQSLE